MFCLPDISAQTASIRKYSVLDGLPQSQVRHIVQDSRGYIWISTLNGLSRFDGIEFVNYFRTNGLPDNQSLYVFEDNNLKIWTLSDSGLSVYKGYGFDYFKPSKEFGEWMFSHPPTVDSVNNIYLLGERQKDKLNRIILFREGEYLDFAKSYPSLDTLKVKECIFNRSAGGLMLLDQFQTIWLWKNNRLSQLSSRKFSDFYIKNSSIMAISNDTLYRFSDGKFGIFDFMTNRRKVWAIKKSFTGRPGGI